MSELQRTILELPPKERLHLASFILLSLAGEDLDSDVDIPEEWIETAKAEIEKMKSGEKKTYSWEEIQAIVRAR